jgi:hypothetical protein
MRLSRGPHLASATFGLVLALAAAALAWGATHDGSVKHGYGTPAQRAAALRTLASAQLPAGLVLDPTFTACGNAGDECLTGSADVAGTVQALGAAFRSAGGKLDRGCSALQDPTPAAGPPDFSCAVEGSLHGAWFIVGLGDGWLLPGHPRPRTAALVKLEVKAADLPVVTRHAALPVAQPAVPAWWPAVGWTIAAEACAAAPASAAPSSAAPSSQPALPDCVPHTTVVRVTASLSLTKAANALATAALTAGFRIDGLPCVNHPGFAGCQVQGERLESGLVGSVTHGFVATLHDDGSGHTIGDVTVTDLS